VLGEAKDFLNYNYAATRLALRRRFDCAEAKRVQAAPEVDALVHRSSVARTTRFVERSR
jgi:hypothetical protein